MSGVVDAIELGREAFARRAWGDAYAHLVSGEASAIEDLERLAVAAYLMGHDEESAEAWQRAQHECVRLGDPDRAARCAFWLGLDLVLRGDMAQGSGWFARAERLLEDADHDCAARGFLLLPGFLDAIEGGDPKTADVIAGEMVDTARRCGDQDLQAFGLLCRGQALLALGDPRGMKLLDEVMVSVSTGEVSPIPAGIVYCAVIETCMNAFDLRRAAQWTDAFYG